MKENEYHNKKELGRSLEEIEKGLIKFWLNFFYNSAIAIVFGTSAYKYDNVEVVKETGTADIVIEEQILKAAKEQEKTYVYDKEDYA